MPSRPAEGMGSSYLCVPPWRASLAVRWKPAAPWSLCETPLLSDPHIPPLPYEALRRAWSCWTNTACSGVSIPCCSVAMTCRTSSRRRAAAWLHNGRGTLPGRDGHRPPKAGWAVRLRLRVVPVPSVVSPYVASPQPSLIHAPDDIASFLRYPLVKFLTRGG